MFVFCNKKKNKTKNPTQLEQFQNQIGNGAIVVYSEAKPY
jgi:hypothetical protein